MAASLIPAVFDRRRVRAHRERASARFSEYDFLKRRVSSDLMERLGEVNRHFGRALDLGCHDGTLAGLLAQSGKAGSVTACDLSARMAALAGRYEGVHAVVADEEALPFAPESFDLVASALSLHWVNDLPGALIQARQALRPDGLFLAALIGGQSLRELRESLLAAEAELTGGAGPRVSPFLDGVDGGALLQRAGFAMPVSDTDTLNLTYASLFALMADLRGMGEAAAFPAPHRGLTRGVLLRAAEIHAGRFPAPGGRIAARVDVVWLTGWAPGPGQPQPRRPGSATVRLADALGTREWPAGEPAGPVPEGRSGPHRTGSGA